MSDVQLLDFFDRHRTAGAPLVLVTVIETAGSTYSKTGHRILIDADGNYQGLVSGGCLEGDLIEHARKVFKTGEPQIVTYEMRGEDDMLWGLGIGCGGMMRLLLQAIVADTQYEPMRLIAHTMQGRAADTLIVVTKSDHPLLMRGAAFLQHQAASAPADPSPGMPLLREALRDARALLRVSPSVSRFTVRVGDHSIEGFQQRVTPIPTILVLGAGPDAVPVVAGFQLLGWRVVVADHRQEYLDRPEFGGAQRQCWSNETSIRNGLPATNALAAIIMTHNLEADARYLRLLANLDGADSDLAYIGLLGPKDRRTKILQTLDERARERVEPLLHGPAGLSIGADSPGSIALSIVAEVYLAVKQSPAVRATPAEEAQPPSSSAVSLSSA